MTTSAWPQAAAGAHQADPYDQLSAEAAQVPPGSGGVLWAPYLMGERTPHLDPDARAALVGLAADHTRANIVRAIMEGVAFSLKDTLTIFKELRIPVRAIRVGGGGARSPLWRQIQADVYGQSVETVQAEEGAAYGAALLAGVGAGVWTSVDTACDKVVRTAKRTVARPGCLTRDAGDVHQVPPALPSLTKHLCLRKKTRRERTRRINLASCSLLRYQPCLPRCKGATTP